MGRISLTQLLFKQTNLRTKIQTHFQCVKFAQIRRELFEPKMSSFQSKTFRSSIQKLQKFFIDDLEIYQYQTRWKTPNVALNWRRQRNLAISYQFGRRFFDRNVFNSGRWRRSNFVLRLKFLVFSLGFGELFAFLRNFQKLLLYKIKKGALIFI